MGKSGTMQSLKDLWRGLVRHPWKSAYYAFTAFSVIFTLITGITHFVPGIRIEGPFALTMVVILSIFYSLKKVWKPSKVDIIVANTNTIIEVLFGDIFSEDGIRAIAVSEFFDSELGKPVSDKSLHGIFLKRCFGGHPESFDVQVDEQLLGIQGINTNKVDGKGIAYPIGTTALVSVDSDRYLLFAFTKVDPNTCKASSDVTMMWEALNKLWQRARIESGGHPLNLPLVGSGLSGLGLPTRDLLNLIILSAIAETKAKQITHKIRIVLNRDRFDEIDLREVHAYWKE
jgi:hypothetical protein